MKDLLRLLVRHDEDISLDIAALDIARIEFPDLEADPWLELLDSYANELSERVPREITGLEFIGKANHFLFEELGFRGNEGDYYSPLNSCLNQVLVERTGLPITLSLVYIEISRRLGRPIAGIGMPGHFLVEYNDGETRRYIDPFHAGRVLGGEECLALASKVTGMNLSDNWNALAPVSKRQMALRMLNNLRAAYLRRGAWAKALEVQDLLVDAAPGEPTEYRQRGYLHLQMRNFHDAARDLGKYLTLAPDARDKEDVARRLKSLRRWTERLN